MKKKQLLSLFVALLLGVPSVFAQNFVVPLDGFSRQKTAYFHFTNGNVMEGKLKGLKRSKGLIQTVKLSDENGNELTVDPSEIEFMYLAPSTLAKIDAALEEPGFSVNNRERTQKVDATLIKDGYVYFEQSKTNLDDGKIEDLMLQLMNPHFSTKIKVYHDPFAWETTSLFMVGVLYQSYYVKKNDQDAAFRLKKKDYKEQFVEFFGDCPELINRYKSKIKWSDFETHIYEYTQLMSK